MEHKSVKENMSNMNISQKMHYIWDYYKLHIIISLIVIISVAMFVSDQVKRKNIILNVSMYGQSIDDAKLKGLLSKANNDLVANTKKDEMIIQFNFKQEALNSESMAMAQKLMAQIAAGELDILVTTRKDYETLSSQGTFMELSWIKNTDSLKGLNYIPGKDENGADREIQGIEVSSIPIFKELQYDYEDKVLAVPANTKNKNKIIEFLNWALKQ